MRTLLIDNYDSYTYNLFQMIAEVNGEEPTVVTNDASDTDLDFDRFDSIVVSPGPGHPERPRDFGVSAAVIARASVPVLGVCLGHQGIAASEGAAVLPAKEARHGYLTRVTHTGEGLFEGIPQEFTAVRYHSLAVAEPLPESLEAVAWAEDGTLMALRHRTRPLWGVQFHPESIETDHGHRLLENFRRLAAAHNTVSGRRGGSGTAGTERPGRTTEHTQLHVRVVEAAVDTQALFSRLYADSPEPSFWLDSARIEPGWSRFSFLGDTAGPLAETVRYRVEDQEVEVTRTGEAPRRVLGTVFDYLGRELARRRVDNTELPFDFTCGYVGYFGYETKADCGSPNRHRSPAPDAVWLFADRFVAVDHQEDATYLVAMSDGTADSVAQAVDWLEKTASVVQFLIRSAPEPRPAADGAAAPVDVEAHLTVGRDRYVADIGVCQSKLLEGESYEICLTNSVWLPAVEDGYQFYTRLRAVNPAPYGAYLRLGEELEVACSSPERFLSITRDGGVETKPIKGTAPRGATPEEDARLRDSLTSSAKTRAENLMIVDLLRNDLGRVCEVGSVHVPRLMATESYTTVHQLVSTIRGRLRTETDAVDCVRACFPGGSMTGAPKLRTMEIIDELETEARGVYSGSIGYLSCNGAADLNIVIRTAVRIGDRWRIGAGGAIVLDSDPQEEYEEMLLKANAPLRAYRTSEAVRR
ncbi:aminodeoxychorismate synthase component I [Thermobifida halotolerans]|uniref:aminodeoxychorismate synthase n=1 Tax=Thermobifida halotolerans TaxID=483545 RepID=A0A399FX09_9ACTN|nr:aminodeoxychorismate synthase component I [Thermobifida halotolerans]UOE18874.1 aminodeoxychorismate synthase component I [Thermobifida halotolerans]